MANKSNRQLTQNQSKNQSNFLRKYSIFMMGSTAVIFSIMLQPVFAFESTQPAPHNTTLIASARGRGTLRVINGTGYDAAVKLVDSRTGETRHFVRIGSGDEITIRGISPCSCVIKAAMGTDWDDRSDRFRYNRSFFQFDDRFEFQETRNGNQVEWMNYTVTLHPVEDGRAQTTPISESSF